jgi:hypothetical protein
VAALAGSRRVVDTTRRLLGVPLWAHEGLSRTGGTPVVDGEIIRGLAVGQAAYIYRGGVTYLQVKRLVAGPAELARPVRRAGGPAGVQELAGTAGSTAGDAGAPDATGIPGVRPYADPLPDVSPVLDEAFGAEDR